MGKFYACMHSIRNFVRSLLRRVKLYDKVARLRVKMFPSMKRHSLVGSPYLWKMERGFQFNFLREHGLRRDHVLLDFGCGTLRVGIPLIQYLNTGNYFGIEIREKVLSEARRELKKHRLESKLPSLICTKILSSHKFERRFDFIWAYSVVIHLTDEDFRDFLTFATRNLSKDGVIFANVNLGESETLGFWLSFPVNVRPFEFYENIASEFGLKVTDLGSLGSFGYREGSGCEQRMLKFERHT